MRSWIGRGMAVWMAVWAGAAAERIDFARDVEPVLKARCTGCHGAAMAQSGLRLDEREAALKGGYSGAVIVAGNSEESTLIHRVTGTRGLAPMPPVGKRLTSEEIAVLRAWIDQGAAWPARAASPKAGGAAAGASKHWAFRRVTRPAVPAGAAHAIDAFVRARLRVEGLRPSAEAGKATLLRRLSLDLTGLPPTPEEFAEFAADRRSDAYERQVERLLASQHYGERWARPWLDVARYADSDGYEKDWSRPHAWRWRHWVIEALNRNLPFDRFTVEQVAGDLLPGATVEQRVATGFHRNTLTNREGGVDNEQFRFENVADRAVTVGSAWLGLTMGCAQCHDHKYDPITQKDFYALYAFFDNAEEEEIDAPLEGETGPWLAKRDEYRAKREALLAEYRVAHWQQDWERNMLQAAAEPGKRTDWDLAWDCLLKLTEGGDGEKILRKPPQRRTARERDVLVDHFVRNYHFAVGRRRYDELKFGELDRKLGELKAAYPQLSQAPVIVESETRRATHLRVRGDYKRLGIEVEPAIPAVLGKLGASRATRLDLARWLASRDNPLTARVIVNRIWQEYFGRGIVETAEDFGVQGSPPTHPELLDWLAAELMETGWDLKRLHRLIVTSATYKQSSAVTREAAERDPKNLWLGRQARLRLPAELIRDSALRAAGLLYPAVGGRSVRPPQPRGVTELGYGGGTKWVESEGKERYRRGLYIHFQRTTPYPLLVNFDAPKGTVTACRRGRTNTPLQALNLLNDPVFVEAAQALGERMREAGGVERGIREGFLRALGREPEAREAERLRAYWEAERSARGEATAWTGAASVLLNLDEFVVRE